MTSRNWFITGTSSGFGRALTEQLLERGDRVAATVRNVASLDDLQSRYGERLWVAELDVTDSAAIHSVVNRAFAAFGSIEVIVNNAGYGLFGAAEEVTDAQIRHQIDTNVIGSIQVTRAALPHLRAQGGGRILQLSSMGGQIAYPALSLYHTTKWAIEGFFEAVIPEVAPFNIQVTLVEPGGAQTSFFRPGSLDVVDKIDAYETTTVGQARRDVAAGKFPMPGDPAKMARAMIDSVDQPIAPKRLTLGSDAYTLVHAALTERIAQLEAGKAVSFSTDVDGWRA